jgi:hypothetical protein
MPAHDERGHQGHEAEDLIHRHGRTRSETDEADQDWQAKLAAAETDQAANAADQRRADKRNRRRAPTDKGERRLMPPELSRGFEHSRFCERLKHAFGYAPGPFSQAERSRRLATRIDLNHLCANNDLDAVPRQAPDHAADRRAQCHAPDRRDDGAILDPITYLCVCLKTATGRGVNSAARLPERIFQEC